MLLALEAGLILHSFLPIVYHGTPLWASSLHSCIYFLHYWWSHSSIVLPLHQADFCPTKKKKKGDKPFVVLQLIGVVLISRYFYRENIFGILHLS